MGTAIPKAPPPIPFIPPVPGVGKGVSDSSQTTIEGFEVWHEVLQARIIINLGGWDVNFLYP